MSPEELDRQVRIAAFRWLGDMRTLHGDTLARNLLVQGFHFEGQRVPILGPQGIFKPRLLPEMPLSITTIPGGPYDDDLRDGSNVIHYRYRGTNPLHHENVGLRKAFRTQTPLVYCYRVLQGWYLVEFPAFVRADHPEQYTFDIQLDDRLALNTFERDTLPPHDPAGADPRREYVTVAAKRRLHQRAFRDRVINAYKTHCAFCRLRHEPLLDAAHIIPDSDDGPPIVSNGLALCKIHHAAFDRHFMTIRPDYSIEVRQSLLNETDGPMLQHGIKNMHDTKIWVPTRGADKPDPSFLEKRYTKFLELQT